MQVNTITPEHVVSIEKFGDSAHIWKCHCEMGFISQDFMAVLESANEHMGLNA